jgi:Sulfotransferase family
MSPASSGSTWIAGMLGHMPHHVFVHELKLCAGFGGKVLLLMQSLRWIIPARLLFVFFEAFERARLWTLDAHSEHLQNQRPELLAIENLKSLQLGNMAREHLAYDTVDSSGASIAMARLLRKAYPNAVFCFILRDPRDVCMSIMHRKPFGKRHTIDQWAHVVIKDYKN